MTEPVTLTEPTRRCPACQEPLYDGACGTLRCPQAGMLEPAEPVMVPCPARSCGDNFCGLCGNEGEVTIETANMYETMQRGTPKTEYHVTTTGGGPQTTPYDRVAQEPSKVIHPAEVENARLRMALESIKVLSGAYKPDGSHIGKICDEALKGAKP